MKKAVCMFLLLLLFTSCGGEKANQEKLETENITLKEQIDDLKTENANLKQQNIDLETQLEDLKSRTPKENPIDAFFRTVEDDGSTASMNIVAGSWTEAWEAETRNLAEELKAWLPLQEDRELVDDYIRTVEEQIERMDVMAIYDVSDVSISNPERLESSGTLRGVLWAGGRRAIWKDTFFQLFYAFPHSSDYTYIFDSAAAETTLAEELG